MSATPSETVPIFVRLSEVINLLNLVSMATCELHAGHKHAIGFALDLALQKVEECHEAVADAGGVAAELKKGK